MNVLSIQSWVSYGYVGNEVAKFALQRLGHEVWSVPTVLYSNHPGHGSFRGRAASSSELADLIEGLEECGVLGRCDSVISGYLGREQLAPLVNNIVKRVRRYNQKVLYCCDPVMGHEGRGLFVNEEVCGAMTQVLVPEADVITPNMLELEVLSGCAINSLDECIEACSAVCEMGPRIVVCTSLSLPNQDGEIATLMYTDDEAWMVVTPRLDGDLFGAGDLFTALLVAALMGDMSGKEALGRAVSGVFGILDATSRSGRSELALIDAQECLITPPYQFNVQPLNL
tara:strand:- start:447 stop:1298 length:852 start_codon:yes stop_codon:yes gene_type:complete